MGKYLLSLLYYKDIILDTHYKLNLQILAENGDLEALYKLAIQYINGLGTQNDKKKAFDLLLTPAKKGNINAKYYLAICYMNGIGTQKNEKKAFDFLLTSAKKGNKDAQYYLGICYTDG